MLLHRRTWLKATACAAGLGGCVAFAAHAAEPAAEPGPPAPAPIELAAGIYMVPGTGGEPDTANLGRVGNTGFIIGRSGVLAIDTGTSCLHGRALLAAIRSVTELPVKLALITHARQEFLFGTGAFREQGIPVAMHEAAAQLMASRCETCLKRLRADLGEAAMQGTEMFKPDIRIADPARFDAAAMIGRSVQVLSFDRASGPGDIAVFEPRSGTLFAGGLVDAQQIPDVSDSDLPTWREALRSLQAMPLDTLVPGHGPAGGKRLVTQTERYLEQLSTRAQALLKAGAPLSEVPDATALPEFASLRGYDSTHRRNAAIVYLRHERAQLLK